MEYKNGLNIFPQELLQEIQKHFSGGLVYIPQVESKRKEWGELSGAKTELCNRNTEIRKRFKQGATITELASDYCLAFETIKRIIYTDKS